MPPASARWVLFFLVAVAVIAVAGGFPWLATHVRDCPVCTNYSSGAEVRQAVKVLPRAACLQTVEERSLPFVNVFVAVLSGSTKDIHKRRRDAVRASWLQIPSLNVSIVARIFLARNAATERESEQHKDVVLIDLASDTYDELPAKMMTIYSWIVAHYKFDFLFKVDDDSLVNFRNLPAVLALAQPYLPHVIVGIFNVKMPKANDVDSAFSVYPDYPSGIGYFLSYTIVHYATHLELPVRKMGAEDAFWGVLLSPFQYNKLNVPNFFQIPFHGCMAARDVFVIHEVYRLEHEGDLWKSFQNELGKENGQVCWNNPRHGRSPRQGVAHKL